VHTQPHGEDKAARHLGRQGFDVYLPRYRRRVRHARRSEELLRPLFPGYLFVRFDPARCRWRSINGTIGVLHILADGDLPRAVPDCIIEEIVAREDESGVVRIGSPSFRHGQPVRLMDGPLADLDGLFEEIRDEHRVVLLISLLGRKVRLQVPTELVAAE
jgi:transcriptional antiterminator RfaH